MTANRFLVLFVILLAGCAGSPPSLPLPTISPATVAPVVQTSTPLRPGAPHATHTAAVGPAHSSNLLPVIPLRQPCASTGPDISFSPRKTWALVSCRNYYASAGTTLRAVRMDGGLEWGFPFKDIYISRYKPDAPEMTSLLQDAFVPAGWTSDEKYVYLAVQTRPDDVAYPGYDGLFRLELATARLSPTLKPAAGKLTSSYAFQFSPGGTQLVYVNQSYQPLVIVIQNLLNGAERHITLDGRFSQAGSFLWSPDEKELLVSAYDRGAHGGNSLILFDLTGTQIKSEALLQNSANLYLPRAWLEATRIYLQVYPQNWAYLDTQTKTITPAPAPTPMP